MDAAERAKLAALNNVGTKGKGNGKGDQAPKGPPTTYPSIIPDKDLSGFKPDERPIPKERRRCTNFLTQDGEYLNYYPAKKSRQK